MTQYKLAELVGLSQAQVRRHEVGESALVLDQLDLYATALGCDPLDLLHGPRPPEPETQKAIHELVTGMSDQDQEIFLAMARAMVETKKKP